MADLAPGAASLPFIAAQEKEPTPLRAGAPPRALERRKERPHAAASRRRSSHQLTGCLAIFMSSTNTSDVLASLAVMPISRRS
jgi:hypothetical protein